MRDYKLVIESLNLPGQACSPAFRRKALQKKALENSDGGILTGCGYDRSEKT
jgi:hypothetical protein